MAKTKAPGAIEFRKLSIGKAFRFAHEWDFLSMKTGVAVKTGKTSYRYVADGMESCVGSSKVLVVEEKV